MIDDLGSATIMPDDPVIVRIRICSIDAQKISILNKTIDNDIINDPTLGKTHQRVLGLGDLDTRNIRYEKLLTDLKRPRPADFDLPHMA